MHTILLAVVVAPAFQEELVLAPLASDPPPPLTYGMSGAGLQEPFLEGGSTEYELGDLNADGHLDVVSIGDHGSPNIGSPQHGVTAWLGNGRGEFSVRQTGNFGYGGVAIGDVNGDGVADVAYGMHHNYSSNDLGDQLLEAALGDGSGAGWTPWDDGLATNGESWGMFATDLADVDADGDLDIASNSFGCCAGVHVYLNQGDGTWVQSFGFLGGNANPELRFGDVNGDGAPDIVVGNSLGGMWIGDGSGGFALLETGLPGTGTSRRGIDLGDVNLDGRDDFLFVHGAGEVAVWSLFGGRWERSSAGLPEASSIRLARIADMNADGFPDVVGVGDAEVRLFTGRGDGDFQERPGFFLPKNGTPEVLRVEGDVDHNGRPDILLMQDEGCGLFCSRNHLYLYRELSQPTRLFAQVISPRSGRLWRQGSVQFVDWLAALPPESNGTVEVELSVSGSSGPWLKLAEGVPADGREQILVPAVTTSDAWVRVQVRAGARRSLSPAEGPFSILP